MKDSRELCFREDYPVKGIMWVTVRLKYSHCVKPSLPSMLGKNCTIGYLKNV